MTIGDFPVQGLKWWNISFWHLCHKIFHNMTLTWNSKRISSPWQSSKLNVFPSIWDEVSSKPSKKTSNFVSSCKQRCLLLANTFLKSFCTSEDHKVELFMQSVNLGWIFPTNFQVTHLAKSHVTKSYLKVLKIPSGSCSYRSPAHGDTGHINRRVGESSWEVSWPCEQSGKTQNWVRGNEFGGVETNQGRNGTKHSK